MQRHVKQSETKPATELKRPVGLVVDDELGERDDTVKPRRKRSTLAWLIGLVVLGIGVALVVDRQPQQETPTAPTKAGAAVPVTVAEVGRDVPIYLEGLGTVQASNTVAIHSQVGGKLQSVNFTEGQMVKAGDVLAVVDPRPFRATLDQAKARRAQDEAQLVSDAKDLARFQDLMKTRRGHVASRRSATGQGRCAEGDHRGRSGRHRERRDAAQLLDDHRADRRTCRFPPGRCRQYCSRRTIRRRSPC